MEKYRFNKVRHIHQILVDGEYRNLTGCTTILNVLSKPALIPWAANMTVGWIKENTNKCDRGVLDDNEYYLVTDGDLEEARKAHTKRKEKAGDYGTKTHEKIALLISEAIILNGGYIKDDKISKDKSIQNFIDWAIKNKVKFLESEKHVYSEKLWLGGIVDFICEIDGKKWISDIKTSRSGIYEENFWQTAGYGIMLKEMKLYPIFQGFVILNLKENGEFNEKRDISIQDNEDVFMACLKIYRIKEKIKNNIL